jgi:hypothetical protein
MPITRVYLDTSAHIANEISTREIVDHEPLKHPVDQTPSERHHSAPDSEAAPRLHQPADPDENESDVLAPPGPLPPGIVRKRRPAQTEAPRSGEAVRPRSASSPEHLLSLTFTSEYHPRQQIVVEKPARADAPSLPPLDISAIITQVLEMKSTKSLKPLRDRLLHHDE